MSRPDPTWVGRGIIRKNFSESTLWVDSASKSQCPVVVCVFVCLCHRGKPASPWTGDLWSKILGLCFCERVEQGMGGGIFHLCNFILYLKNIYRGDSMSKVQEKRSMLKRRFYWMKCEI